MISFFAMIFIGLGNKIFQKLQTAPMHNYPFFLNLWTTFIYIPCSFAYIIPAIRYTNLITPEERAVPQYKFAVMGTLDGLAGIMQIFASNYLPGGLLILLQQSAIPISMAISRVLLKAKYKLYHYIGALIVFGGLVIVLLPMFLHPDPGQKNAVLWVIVMLLSCVPMTLSSVYKEKALGDVDIDVVYLNGWVAVYQFLTCIPFAIPSAYAVGLTVSDVPSSVSNGFRCYIGHNSVTTATSSTPLDDCSRSTAFVNIYLIFNLSYNILIILILKYGSANILWLALTIMVPMGNAAFALDFVPGHKPMKGTDIGGLVVIMTGLIVYRFWHLIQNKFFTKPGSATELEETAAGDGKKRARLYVRGDQVEAAEALLETIQQRPPKLERSSTTIRSAYFSRLGISAHGRGADSPPRGSVNRV
jgi:drug/metabolite transporter (DMT)-like permease